MALAAATALVGLQPALAHDDPGPRRERVEDRDRSERETRHQATGDFSLSVTGRARPTRSPHDGFSVVFARTGPDDYSWVNFNETDGVRTSGVFRMAGGRQTEVADIATAVVPGRKYRVRLERDGGELRVYLDARLVTAVSDRDVQDGDVDYLEDDDDAPTDRDQTGHATDDDPEAAAGDRSLGTSGDVDRDETGVVLLETFGGASGALGSRRAATGQRVWHVEPGSAQIRQVGGVGVKQDRQQFHRMFSAERFGGPGTTVRITYRARATAIRNRAGSTIVEGAKLGLKWPAAASPYGEDDVRSVYGTSSQDDPASPGSYIFLTGLTEGGYMELSRNGYGRDGYEFFANERVGYRVGTWKDVTVTVEWLPTAAEGIRVRYWHNATGSGAPVYEAVDDHSPFWSEPGFLWLRTDDADWEYDHLRVEEIARSRVAG